MVVQPPLGMDPVQHRALNIVEDAPKDLESMAATQRSGSDH